jgi:lipoprotein-anchoring transpeptidase ErfK/SrfK
MTSLRTFLIASALLAGAAAASPASASELTGPGARNSPSGFSDSVRLAQADDVQIYYDGRGRRVIVDAYTGQILAIQPPEGRRALRRSMRRPAHPERYYLDDPEDMERLRRDSGGYSIYPGDGFGEGPDDGYSDWNDPVERTARGEGLALPDEPSDIIVEPDYHGTVEAPVTSAPRKEVAELQVLLDRKGASPGVIDGQFGSNVDKGLAAYREVTGEVLRSTDAAGIKKALAESGGDPFIDYTITAEDAAGPFIASVPADYGRKARLERLSYTSVSEMLAERFHMDEKYLKALNPEANFGRPGTVIKVANVGLPLKEPVARIVADKTAKQVRAYNADGKLVAAYPATIGSSDTPSPTGTHTVARVAFNPDYTYNPNVNFQQGDNFDILKIPPGPNGPVGSVWIALSKPTYGIHGTPDPSKIGKTESHGCVRLTNWDAEELAKNVKEGVVVTFTD